VRVLSAVLAATTVLFFGLTYGPLMDQERYVASHWTGAAAAAIFGIPLILAAFAGQCTLRGLRVMHGAYAAIFAAVVLSWIPAFVNGPMPAEVAPWVVGMTALGTVPAAIAWRPAIAWGFLIGICLVIAPIRFIADGGADVSLALQFSFFTITICAVFTAVVAVALGAARDVDRATAAARTSTMRAAALTARAEEQANLDGLVHDHVIATIFAAAGAGRTDSEATRAHATHTISLLRELRDGGVGVPELLHPDYFVQGLATSILDMSDAVELTVTGERNSPIPSAVASALIESTVEALRNSVVHAAPDSAPVQRVVELWLTAEQVRISIADDGRGFDAESVPDSRLGIVVSILGRVNALAGGHASVWSERGVGTRVTVGWQQ